MRFQEIRLENFADIENIISESKFYAVAKDTDVQKHFNIVGKDAITKFGEVYGITFDNYKEAFANEGINGLKIQGGTKIILYAEIIYCFDTRSWASEKMKKGCFYVEHVGKIVEYNGVLMNARKPHRNKGFMFFLFNDDTDLSQVEVEKPNYVGTLTDKKMEEWLNVLLEEKNLALSTKNENEIKVRNFKNSLADLLHLPLSEFKDNSGTIRLGMFNISYQCDVNTGYTSSKIDFDICAKKEDGRTYLTTFDRIKILSDAGLLN